MRNEALRTAWDFVENTGRSIFLTGKAGTGKTTFLHTVVQKSRKRSIVVAPTGVAAINAGGVTIHSFFQLPFAPFGPNATIKNKFDFSAEKRRIIASLDLLIIDEISMVRSDLLDAIDSVLRRFRDRYQPFRSGICCGPCSPQNPTPASILRYVPCAMHAFFMQR